MTLPRWWFVGCACWLAAAAAAADGREGESAAQAGEIASAAASEQRSTRLRESPRRKKGKRRRAVSSRRRRRRAGPRARRGYRKLKRSWQAPSIAWQLSETAVARVPGLVLVPVGEEMPAVLIPESAEGGFSEHQVAIATRAFGSFRGGPSVHPRLLSLLYAATRHFDVPHLHLISGVRKDRRGSRHTHGLAADVVLPGVDNEELASYFRGQGFVGVGTYPRAGFVHVDVREASYFWVDPSPPGQSWRIRPVHADEARAADAAALSRGEEPITNPKRLARAMSARERKRKKAHRARRAAKRSRLRAAHRKSRGDEG